MFHLCLSALSAVSVGWADVMILITALASFHSHFHFAEASIQFKDLTTAKVFKYRYSFLLITN